MTTLKKEEKPKPTKQERIAKYLGVIPGAIDGAAGGKQTFKAACALFNGWALTEAETLAWLKVYNAKCEPPWSDKELEHKAKDAAKAKHDKPRGYLLNASMADQREEPDWSLPTKPIASGKMSVTLTTLFFYSPLLCRERTSIFHVSREEIEKSVVNVVKTDSPALVCPENDPKPADTDPEARRIAGELVKLQRAGAIKSDQDAEFYANLIRIFDATYTGPAGSTSPDNAILTDEQIVPPPPDGLSAEERAAYYQKDLADAFGEQYIDRDYQPPAKPARSSIREKKRSPRKNRTTKLATTQYLYGTKQ